MRLMPGDRGAWPREISVAFWPGLRGNSRSAGASQQPPEMFIFHAYNSGSALGSGWVAGIYYYSSST
uniref:Uncharacterized protein n=1 Tax=Aegilops tauschii subsp. strangulata TaxID=200361 RepID=A0A453B8L8_AEGTS